MKRCVSKAIFLLIFNKYIFFFFLQYLLISQPAFKFESYIHGLLSEDPHFPRLRREFKTKLHGILLYVLLRSPPPHSNFSACYRDHPHSEIRMIRNEKIRRPKRKCELQLVVLSECRDIFTAIKPTLPSRARRWSEKNKASKWPAIWEAVLLRVRVCLFPLNFKSV